MAQVSLRVRWSTGPALRMMSFDAEMLAGDVLDYILKKTQAAEFEGIEDDLLLYSPPNADRPALWLAKEQSLASVNLTDRDTLEIKFKPHVLIVLNSEGKDGWLSEFQFGQTSRFQVTSLLVDYRDPLGSLIPILKTYVKQKTATEYVFQHVYEGPSGPAVRWLNSNLSLFEQDVPHNGYVCMYPLSSLLKGPIDSNHTETVMEGWLTKKSIKAHKSTNPKKRYCQISDNMLYYKPSQSDKMAAGFVALEYYTVAQDEDRCEFILSPASDCSFTNTLPTYVFSSDKDTYTSWLRFVVQRTSIGSCERQFGISLRKVVSRKGKIQKLPSVVTETIAFLDNEHCTREELRGLEAEGLFRISGGASRLQHCKDELDRGVVPDFAHWNDPHVVAGLLKQYVRELPEPLIPFEQYDDFLALNENDPGVASQMKELAAQIPTENVECLAYLLPFLRRVSERSDKNLMTASNLALVFGPNILRPRSGDASVLASDSNKVCKIMELLIIKQDEIFSSQKGFKAAAKPSAKTGPRVGARGLGPGIGGGARSRIGARAPAPPVRRPQSLPLAGQSIEDAHGNAVTRGVRRPPPQGKFTGAVPQSESAVARLREKGALSAHKLPPAPVLQKTEEEEEEEAADEGLVPAVVPSEPRSSKELTLSSLFAMLLEERAARVELEKRVAELENAKSQQ